MSSFSATHWVLFGLVAYGIYRLLTASKRGRAERYCKSCGTVATSVTATNGSIWIEIVLWCLLIVPGVVYSIWRMTTRHQKCPACGSRELVPTDSPIAKAALASRPLN